LDYGEPPTNIKSGRQENLEWEHLREQKLLNCEGRVRKCERGGSRTYMDNWKFDVTNPY